MPRSAPAAIAPAGATGMSSCGIKVNEHAIAEAFDLADPGLRRSNSFALLRPRLLIEVRGYRRFGMHHPLRKASFTAGRSRSRSGPANFWRCLMTRGLCHQSPKTNDDDA